MPIHLSVPIEPVQPTAADLERSTGIHYQSPVSFLERRPLSLLYSMAVQLHSSHGVHSAGASCVQDSPLRSPGGV
jgi:hypothetical protein